MLDRIKLGLNYLLPKKCFTELIGWIANKKAGWFTKLVIDIFVWYYNIDMKECKKSDTSEYYTFNEFFVRSFNKKARPINQDPCLLVQPADGVINQIGKIQNDNILQAKGHNYSLEALLAGNYQLSNKFINGLFITIYIKPKNYHRIHMPYSGSLVEMTYVPGELYSLNTVTTKNIPNLFARNERIICCFNTDFGLFVQILIGAIIVGSIETVWSGQITPPRKGIIKRWTHETSFENNFSLPIKNSVNLVKGQEMGRFKLGSTVINLFVKDKIKFLDHLIPSSKTFVGQPLASILDFKN